MPQKKKEGKKTIGKMERRKEGGWKKHPVEHRVIQYM